MPASSLSTRASACTILAGLAALASFTAVMPPAAAQEKDASPLFSWDPSVGWIGAGEWRAVPGQVAPISNDPKYPFVPNGQGKQPTYRIADLTYPNLKPWAKEAMKKDIDEVHAGKIAFTPSSSCVPAGVPAFMHLGGNQNAQWFLQTPKEVVIVRAADSQVRHVYMNVPHSANPKPSWYGESVGHYEGDTLVIDTIGLNTKTYVDAWRTPHTEKLHVIERWRMIENRQAMEVTFTVDDPDTYYQPWTAARRYRRAQMQFGEDICAENNQQIFDYAIPVAGKPDF